MSENREFTLFDIADWLWSYRFLALTLLVISGIWASISVFTAHQSAFSQQYEVHVRIYPSGSPLRDVSDISSIVITKLEKPRSVELTSGPNDNPLIFKASGVRQADAAVEELVDLDAAMTKEVMERVAVLEPIIATNEAAITPYLIAMSFLAGADSGMLKLLTPESVLVSTNGASPSLLRAVIFPVIICAIAFFVLAMGKSFVRAWRQRKLKA